MFACICVVFCWCSCCRVMCFCTICITIKFDNQGIPRLSSQKWVSSGSSASIIIRADRCAVATGMIPPHVFGWVDLFLLHAEKMLDNV